MATDIPYDPEMPEYEPRGAAGEGVSPDSPCYSPATPPPQPSPESALSMLAQMLSAAGGPPSPPTPQALPDEMGQPLPDDVTLGLGWRVHMLPRDLR